ncbi:response regulator transcription factor [Actinosynnema sp. NPDC047251]|uniref:Two-component system, response regulator of the winged helix family n=1 Tax=Saccharothrix espanaensis (strain ATCC 51144 / DSM 44229 / JCM 9112 / NBRC 15066 / NRRL 15764) TaxID=1179773 RepID=K0K6W5_SACES|nr:response regulator transcription factor [Saccharothrix espanaensis]CCH32619.1 Two-component system, response regulator of the winged helix family [Saccharothrix espanaensis DSM 44229]
MKRHGRVLVVEDERSFADALAAGLRADGFEVETAEDGLLGLDAVLSRPFDVVVLDLMLPGLTGLDVCARLRRAGVEVPVLVLTARDGELDQLRALRIGADDYLTKPFSYRVLLARLHVLLRRSGPRGSDVLAAGDLVLDRVGRRCRRGETAIELTPREFALLELLMSRPGQVVSKRFAIDEVWDPAIPVQSNVLEVYIAYLRRKVDVPFGRHAIGTVRGCGYRLDPGGG